MRMKPRRLEGPPDGHVPDSGFSTRVSCQCPVSKTGTEMALPLSRKTLQNIKVLIGAPEEIRTPNPQIRSLVLYPIELRAPARSGGVAHGLQANKPGRPPRRAGIRRLHAPGPRAWPRAWSRALAAWRYGRYTRRLSRSVAQPGRALCSGRRGRRFESSHSDQ